MNLERTRFEAPGGHFGGPPDLAHIDPFEIGAIRVTPAERRVESPEGTSTVLEPLVMQVLVALADARGRIMSRDDLVVACWGRRIVGDDAVNRVMSRLRRNLFETCGNRVRITTVSKVGYRLEVMESVDLAADSAPPPADRGFGAEPEPRRRIAAVVLGICGIAAFAGAVFFVASPAAGVAIAIEPAAGASADGTATAFASDLTNDLAELTGPMTRVTLVEPDAPTGADMTLQVAYRGNATEDGARVRLVDAANGAVIWSRVFESRHTPEAVVRERAAHAIAGVIRCGLDRSAGNLGDPVSRRLYFTACDAVQMRDWPRALSLARQIVSLRPGSAASWACLAITTVLQIDPAQADYRAKADQAYSLAQRALSIDPHSGLANQALAMALALKGEQNFAALESGIREDPEHGWLLALYAIKLFDTGYASASVDPLLHAIELEPGDPAMAESVVYGLLGVGRVSDARAMVNEMERVWPGDPTVGAVRDELLFYDADPVMALATFERGRRRDPYGQILHAQLRWRASPHFDWISFDEFGERMVASSPEMAWTLAFASERMGDSDRALRWMTRAQGQPGREPWWQLFWAEAAELRRDPRFFAKMAEVGLVAEWQRRGRWPDFCQDRRLRYDCKREAKRLSPAITT